MKGWFYGIVSFVALCVLFIAWFGYYTKREVEEMVHSDAIESVGYATDHLSASYNIEGSETLFVNGEATLPEGGTVRVVGDPIGADLDADGTEDRIVLLETSSASERFARRYLAVALSHERGYSGSNAVPLGQGTYEIGTRYDIIVVSADEIPPVQPMESPTASTTTSVEHSRYFYIFGSTLIEHGPFEERDAALMEGYYSRSGDEHTFTDCAGKSRTVSNESRAFAVSDVIYRERNDAKKEETPVFMVVVASVEDTADEDTPGTVSVQAVLSAPSSGVCGSTQVLGSELDPVGDMFATTSSATTSDERE